MRKLLSFFTILIGLSAVALDADARRVGGGKSVGKQQSISPQQAAPKAPAQQQQATPNTPTQQQAAAPAAANPAKPSGMSRFLGPLAGLAIGAGLASLFMNNGLGGALMGILLALALGMGIFFLVRMFLGRGQRQVPLGYAGATPSGRVEPTAAPAQPTQTAYSALPTGAAAHSVAAATSGAPPHVAAPAVQRWPADFNAAEFVRHAKVNFVKVQEANDRRDVEAIRDFLTPALAAEIEADMRTSGEAAQTTEVITLDGEVLDVVTDATMHTVSVRFSGLIREAVGAQPQPFTEIWHLEKPVSGFSGWQVAGIQQA
ncbi:MAG: TIM44-like domain-containing protein [Pseudomonadota bacterium]